MGEIEDNHNFISFKLFRSFCQLKKAALILCLFYCQFANLKVHRGYRFFIKADQWFR